MYVLKQKNCTKNRAAKAADCAIEIERSEFENNDRIEGGLTPYEIEGIYSLVIAAGRVRHAARDISNLGGGK